MEWDGEKLIRLHRIFSDRSWKIAQKTLDPSRSAQSVDLAWHMWAEHLSSIGLKMELSCNRDYDENAPRAILNDDGSTTVRLINMWGDRYIDIPEEFAVRALALGFLP
jgi:hypothetical protein